MNHHSAARRLLMRASFLVLIAALALSACTPAATPAPSVDWSKATSAAEAGGMDALVAAAKQEGQLSTIALPRDWCNYGEMIDTFKSKYGLTVNELDPLAGSNDELNAIKDNKDNPGPQSPDVVDIGVGFGPTAKTEGLVAPYKVATWDTISGVKDPEGYWYADYGGVLVFQVNKDLVTNIPQDWSDLLKGDYQSQVALAGDPRSSNQAAQTVLAAALANGGSLDNVLPGLEYFKQLNQAGNLLPLIADSGVFAKGEAPITFQWDYLAKTSRDNLAGNPEVEIVYPKSGIMGGFYVQGVSAYAPHPAAARLWQEFVFSDEGQQIWMRGYCVPSRFSDMAARNVIADDLLAKMPDPEVMAAAVFPSVDQLSAMREEVAAQWDNVTGLTAFQESSP